MTLEEKNNLKKGDVVWIDLSDYSKHVQKGTTKPVQKRISYDVNLDEFYIVNDLEINPIKQVIIKNFNPSSNYIYFNLFFWNEVFTISVHISDIHLKKPNYARSNN